MSARFSARCLWLAAACAGLSSPPVRAQLTAGTQLDPVVVTTIGYPQPLADSIAHSTVLTREDIERSQAVDLPSLLAREAGLQMTRNGGRGAATTLFLRGAPSSQVLLLIDGVPQTRQDATGALSVEHLMLDQVDRVEVVRGNVSAIYGSGAIGGVIQVFTRRGAGAPGGDVTVEGGSYGYGRLGANASGQFGDTRLAVGIAGQRSRGFSAQDPVVNPAVNPDNDGYRNGSGSASISHDWAAGHTVGAVVTQSDGRLDYDSGFATPADLQTSRTKITTARLTSSDQFTADWRSQLSYGWQQDDSQFEEGGAFGYSSHYTSGNELLNWSHRYTLNPDWKLSAGLEWQRQSIATDDGFGGVYDQSRNVGAVFAGAQGQVGARPVRPCQDAAVQKRRHGQRGQRAAQLRVGGGHVQPGDIVGRNRHRRQGLAALIGLGLEPRRVGEPAGDQCLDLVGAGGRGDQRLQPIKDFVRAGRSRRLHLLAGKDRSVAQPRVQRRNRRLEPILALADGGRELGRLRRTRRRQQRRGIAGGRFVQGAQGRLHRRCGKAGRRDVGAPGPQPGKIGLQPGQRTQVAAKMRRGVARNAGDRFHRGAVDLALEAAGQAPQGRRSRSVAKADRPHAPNPSSIWISSSTALTTRALAP